MAHTWLPADVHISRVLDHPAAASSASTAEAMTMRDLSPYPLHSLVTRDQHYCKRSTLHDL